MFEVVGGPSIMAGYGPPSILSYLVAYNGPARMKTVLDWNKKIHTQEGLVFPYMGCSDQERIKISSPSLDGIFVLGKDFQHFDNMLMSYITPQERARHQEGIKWVSMDAPNGNLLMLFLFLTAAISGSPNTMFNPDPYLESAGDANSGRRLDIWD
jgi:hypothetical protein